MRKKDHKIKVLFIVNSPFLSGAEISAINLLKFSNSDRFDFVLLLPARHKFPIHELTHIRVIELPFEWFLFSLNPFVLAKYILNIIYCSLRIHRIIRINRINIIYSNSVKSHIYGTVAKFLSNRKTIWHVRDVPARGVLRHFLGKYSDKVITVSKFIDKRMHGIRSSREMVYNGVDTILFSNAHLECARNVTMVSQITKWKNIDDFLDIAKLVGAQSKDVRFLLVGDSLNEGDIEYKNHIVERISSEAISNLVFQGWTDDIKAVYQVTGILVHTAIEEPFGRVIAEAMAMDIPVVAYRSGGPSEMIIDGVTGYLVEPYNCRLMAEKLLSLVKSPERMEKFGANGRRRAEQYFGLKNHLQLVENIFLDLNDQYSNQRIGA